MLTRCAPSQGGMCTHRLSFGRNATPRRARRSTAGVSLAVDRRKCHSPADAERWSLALDRPAGGREQLLVESLGWGSPSERLARSTVDRGGDRREVVQAIPGEVGALREDVPAGRWCSRWGRAATGYAVRRSTRQAGQDPQLAVLGHLGALVPGQRPAQLLRQRCDRAGDRVADRLGAVAGERGTLTRGPSCCIGGR